MLRCSFLQKAAIQRFDILRRGLARVDQNVAALHGIGDHRRDLVLGHADIGELRGDTQLGVELLELVDEHLGNEGIIGLLAVGDVVVDLAVTAVVRQCVELNDGGQQDRVATPCATPKKPLDRWLMA